MSPSAGDPGERLRHVRSFDEVVEYLRDHLDWPIEADDLDDATFDWEPQELGIPEERVPHLSKLRQLRPLTASQPWGIFFVEFEGPRLPITPLRRLLQSLVVKKRATGDGSRRSWDLNDLLFVITTDSGDSVELHFVAFFNPDKPTPEIRSLPWRPRQSPTRHLRRLATELLPHLTWPEDPSETELWRDTWREAFKLKHGEAITSAARLADRMAATAKDFRALISGAIDDEHGSGPFTSLMEEVHQQLVSDLDQDKFADMCAQTLVYGLLSSRITDPEGFGASPSLATVPLSNAFLSAFFEQVHDQVVDIERGGDGLDTLVNDLRATNVEAILDQFGSTAKGGDPVIHFYEEFLKQYDRKMRADSGAFYTPQPVVAFMVRGVDRLLRERFGLEAGIADTTPWAEVAAAVGFDVPEGVDPAAPFLSMVDPATGTGTFLVEWLKQARASFLATHSDGDWAKYLEDRLLDTMHAFELMLGPYSIAHLKVALELYDEGARGSEVTILLTDTLDHAPPQQAFDTGDDPLAVEGRIARDLKDDERFTVVIGNPPYDREQRSASETNAGKRKGGIVRHGVPGTAPLLDDIIEPMRTAGLGRHVKNLYNDYVYFWRWATWQATELPPGPGIVAFITASSYLDGVSMGGLRYHLRERFDELWIVDLGGEGRGAVTEENVFDIRTPVAVAFGVATGIPTDDHTCTVRYRRLRGTRQEKFEQLATLELTSEDFEAVEGTGLDRFTPRTDADYHTWPEITELFPWIHSGCQVKRTWPIGPSANVLNRRWDTLRSAAVPRRGQLMKETRDRKTTSRLRPLHPSPTQRMPAISSLDVTDEPERIEPYGHRSFDRQWIIADNRIADFPRPQLWRSRSNQQLYLTTLTSTKLGRGPVVTATPYVPDLHHFSGRGAKNVMPLFRDAAAREPNITDGLLDVLSDRLAVPIDAEAFVAYVYALTGTPAFADRFASELGEGAGPVRIPITEDADLFREAVTLGRELLWIHSWGERFQPDDGRSFPSGSAIVERPITTYPNGFRYDEENQQLIIGDGVIGGVAPEVWEFEVSGLKVVRSWLGYRMADRKGRKSSPLDDIRPSKWTFTEELLTLLAILERTLELTPEAADLLQRIVDGPVLDAADLPTPADYERKPPKA